MKYLLALAALLYSQIASPEQTQEVWQSWMFGAPCTLNSDYEDGVCVVVEVSEINWSKKNGIKLNTSKKEIVK